MGFDANAEAGILIPIDDVFAAIPPDLKDRCARRLWQTLREEAEEVIESGWITDARWAHISPLLGWDQANAESFLVDFCRALELMLPPFEEDDERGVPIDALSEDFCNFIFNHAWFCDWPDDPAPLKWPDIVTIMVFSHAPRSHGHWEEVAVDKQYFVFSERACCTTVLTPAGRELAQALKKENLEPSRWVSVSY